MTETPNQSPAAVDQRVKEALANHLGWTDRGGGIEGYLCSWEYEKGLVPVERIGLVEVVDVNRAADIDDEEGPLHIVWKIEGLGETRFYRMRGQYISHDGSHWYPDTFGRVSPRVKTVIVYEFGDG